MTAARKSIRRALMIARPAKADGGDVDDGFKEALKEGFGDRPLGFSAETKQQMNTGTPIGAFNRGVVEPVAVAADAALRGANAGVYGVAHAARRAYENVRPHLPESWTQSVGTPQALERDIRDMPNAFMGEINAVPRNAAQTAVNIARKPMAPAERGMVSVAPKRSYPLADRGEWYGDANYQNTGGAMTHMSPDEFLSQVRPLEIDDVARENIDELKKHILSGKTLDPLQISAAGKEDGRHRAYAAKELGIDKVPVLTWKKTEPEPNYFSSLERGIADAKQAKASPQEWKAIASKFPKEEVDWRGLNAFLDSQKGSVTKDQVLAHLKGNPVDVQEVWKGAGVPSAERQMRLKAADDAFTNYLIKNHKFDERGARDFGLSVANNDLTESQTKFLHSDPELTKQSYELLDAYRARQAKDHLDVTKYHEYQLPGGQNYRELLLTMPDNAAAKRQQRMQDIGRRKEELQDEFDARAGEGDEPHLLAHRRSMSDEFNRLTDEWYKLNQENDAGAAFKSKHWDEPNILAHVRMNDRTGPDGQKILHIEELQSDWHQKGKAQGYKGDKLREPPSDWGQPFQTNKGTWLWMDRGVRMSPQEFKSEEDVRSAMREAYNKTTVDPRIPNAPFKDTKDWTALALKRVMRYAADNGYDGISWTTGAQQADRYDLGKTVGEIHYDPHPRAAGKPISHGDLEVYDHDGNMIMNEESVSTDRLADMIGKDAAKRIIEEPTKRAGNYHILSGDGLRVGGQGMHEYYDKIVPSVANKLAKAHGAQVGKTQIGGGGNYQVVLPNGKVVAEYPAKNTAEATAQSFPGAQVKEPTADVHYMPIKPTMKGKAHKMFQRGGRVDHAPSEAQKAAGNYKKEHVKFHGLNIAIENKKGSTRSGKDANGKAWSCTLPADYGYIKRTEGADGDHVDVYLGPDRSSQQVFIVNQHDHKTGRFDEHKCMLGYNSERAAVADYCKAFSDGKGADRLKSIEPVSMDAFKQWLKTGNTKKSATSRNIVDHALKLTSTLATHRSAKRHV